MIICTTCPLPSSRLGTRIKLWFPLVAFSTLDLTVLQVIQVKNTFSDLTKSITSPQHAPFFHQHVLN